MKTEQPSTVQPTTTNKETIRAYIMSSINIKELGDDVDIFASGLTNSLFAIQLMTFIEKEFKIKITIDDLGLDNLKSVNAIAKFVDSKRQDVMS